MEETILTTLLNFGIFPCVTIYLMFIIIKDFKSELATLKSLTDEDTLNSINQFNKIQNSLDKLITINEQMQNYLNNYLNNLIIKLLDVLDDFDKY